MKHTYYAYFIANNGTCSNLEPYKHSSKQKAISDIREIVKENHYHEPYNTSSYVILDESKNVVTKGSYHDCGCWRKDCNVEEILNEYK